MSTTDRSADGTALWSSDTWLAEATGWIDARLADAGLTRVADVDQAHLRPWATILRAPTGGGDVWFKAAGAGTAFEVPLYDVLARTAPEHVLTPLAIDVDRSWVLLPDGGTPIGERLEGRPLADALAEALIAYGEFQRTMTSHVDELLALGVADMRPAAMSERFDEAVEATAGGLDDASDEQRDAHRRVAAMRPTFEAWCDELAASNQGASLDHNDLHPWNVLGGGREDVRFYDWGDAVVAHPFAAMLVPLGFVGRLLEVGLDDPAFVQVRDGYLRAVAPDEPAGELAGTLAVACRVAKVARVLTWHRAVSAAQRSGDEVEEYYAQAPLATLVSLLDESYLGGA